MIGPNDTLPRFWALLYLSTTAHNAFVQTRHQTEGGRDDPDPCFVTQTILSMDETSDVIDAVREIAGLVDVMLVMGARNSSNSNRLHELTEKVGVKAYLIDDTSMIEAGWKV